MDKSIPRGILQPLVDQELSRTQIARRLGTTHGRVSYWIEKYGLEAKRERSGHKPAQGALEQLYELRVQILTLEAREKKLIKAILTEEGGPRGSQTHPCS